jgi:hypothetical protein
VGLKFNPKKEKKGRLCGRHRHFVKNIILPIEFDVPKSNNPKVPKENLGFKV